jgi:hypothetical protein
MRLNASVTILVTGLIGACNGAGSDQSSAGTEATGPTPPIPKIDLSTPDRAIRTYWALQDHVSAVRDDPTTADGRLIARAMAASEKRATALNAILGGVTTGAAKAELEAPTDMFGDTARVTMYREILEVKNESETRAVVLARVKNTTPVPSGKRAFDEEEARDGKVYRYVFEREAAGWKLAQVFSQSRYSKEWQPYFTPPLPWVHRPVPP